MQKLEKIDLTIYLEKVAQPFLTESCLPWLDACFQFNIRAPDDNGFEVGRGEYERNKKKKFMCQ